MRAEPTRSAGNGARTRAGARSALSAAAACALLAGVAFAQAVPLPPSARSVVPSRIRSRFTARRRSLRAPRRVAAGRVPALDARRARDAATRSCRSRPGPTCASATWSSRRTRPRTRPPRAADGLPYEYLQVVDDGTRGYATLADHLADEYATAFGSGFTLAVASRVQHDGLGFVRTRGGQYVLERALRPVRPSAFAGAKLEPGELARMGWVVQDGATIADTHSGRTLRGPRGSRASRYARSARASARARGRRHGRRRRVLALRRRRDRRARRAPSRAALAAPASEPTSGGSTSISRAKRWSPIRARRRCSRRSSPRDASARPRAHRAVRFASGSSCRARTCATRRPTSSSAATRSSRCPGCSTSQGYGLHAAFWHERFGEPYSRGCINLSPRDARCLFAFTAPALPPGWFAVRPAESDPGTWPSGGPPRRARRSRLGP